MNINKLHYFSGITLSLFIGLHLFNHLVALFGANAHIQVMNILRVIYRNPVTETFLLIVVVIQAISGIRLVSPIIRRGRKGSKRGKNTSFYDKLQVYSGLYLAFFLVAHTIATVWQGRQVLQLQNLRTLTLRKILLDHFFLNHISELIPIINVSLVYRFF